jgi:hypothetical protein
LLRGQVVINNRCRCNVCDPVSKQQQEIGGACGTHAKFWSKHLKVRDRPKEPNVNGKIILEWMLGIGFIWLRMGPVAGSCEHGNEHLGSIKGGEFHD